MTSSMGGKDRDWDDLPKRRLPPTHGRETPSAAIKPSLFAQNLNGITLQSRINTFSALKLSIMNVCLRLCLVVSCVLALVGVTDGYNVQQPGRRAFLSQVTASGGALAVGVATLTGNPAFSLADDD